MQKGDLASYTALFQARVPQPLRPTDIPYLTFSTVHTQVYKHSEAQHVSCSNRVTFSHTRSTNTAVISEKNLKNISNLLHMFFNILIKFLFHYAHSVSLYCFVYFFSFAVSFQILYKFTDRCQLVETQLR